MKLSVYTDLWSRGLSSGFVFCDKIQTVTEDTDCSLRLVEEAFLAGVHPCVDHCLCLVWCEFFYACSFCSCIILCFY